LTDLLVVGARIQLGEKYCQGRSCEAGEIITLVDGEFDDHNGLCTTTETAPAIWCEQQKEFDSIYHLFGNDLEEFEDCKVLDN
jgi:recombinational DNA repair protein RecR